MNKAIRILIVDDLELYRHGVRHMLELEEDMDVVGDCDAEEAPFKIARLHPDMVLTCMKMPELKWAIRNSLAYGVDVIVLAESLDYRAEALEAGAVGYFLKDITLVGLAHAIRQVYRGRGEAEEAVELVISSPSNAVQLFRYTCQLEELLHDHHAIIISTIGTRDRGFVIMVQLPPATVSGLLIKLASMPEVEKVEEQPLAGDAFARKLKLRIRPSKRFSVTLKE